MKKTTCLPFFRNGKYVESSIWPSPPTHESLSSYTEYSNKVFESQLQFYSAAFASWMTYVGQREGDASKVRWLINAAVPPFSAILSHLTKGYSN